MQKRMTVSSPYFCHFHRRMRESVRSFVNCSVLWVYHSEERQNSFVGYGLVFIEKFRTQLKSKVLI